VVRPLAQGGVCLVENLYKTDIRRVIETQQSLCKYHIQPTSLRKSTLYPNNMFIITRTNLTLTV